MLRAALLGILVWNNTDIDRKRGIQRTNAVSPIKKRWREKESINTIVCVSERARERERESWQE